MCDSGPELPVCYYLCGCVFEDFLNNPVNINGSSIWFNTIDNQRGIFHQRLIFLLLFHELLCSRLHSLFQGNAVFLNFLPCPVERFEHVIERTGQGADLIPHWHRNFPDPFARSYLSRRRNDVAYRAKKDRHHPNNNNGREQQGCHHNSKHLDSVFGQLGKSGRPVNADLHHPDTLPVKILQWPQENSQASSIGRANQYFWILSSKHPAADLVTRYL